MEDSNRKEGTSRKIVRAPIKASESQVTIPGTSSSRETDSKPERKYLLAQKTINGMFSIFQEALKNGRNSTFSPSLIPIILAEVI